MKSLNRFPFVKLFWTLVFVLLSLESTTHAQTPVELMRDWQRQRITRIPPSKVRHADLKRYLDQLRLAGTPVREVGRSVANREIYELEFGTGKTRVFLWSQMHGDEPTATSALIDIFAYLRRNRNEAWVKKLASEMTLRAVPMLNPDGAEIYQRRNLQGIDINRDARRLATPEGKLLKRLRDEWSPHIGFNLHNQNPRTAVGDTREQATISLLAVPFDERNSDNPGRIRNKRLCAVMIKALAPFLAGHIGRYDDTFNPRAFGDSISRAGTPVILIETGALKGKTEDDLVGFNFVAILSSLGALADGTVERADPRLYETLPYNSLGNIFNLVVRNATIINLNRTNSTRILEFAGDLALNNSIEDIGDLSFFRGLDEVDAGNYFVATPSGTLRPGADDVLLFYRKARASEIDFAATNLEDRFPPDAVYRDGKWRGKDSITLRPHVMSN